MKLSTLVEVFSSEKYKELFRRGAQTLIEEMKNNDYKISVRGADLFLDNCSDILKEEVRNFYRMCVVGNIDLFEKNEDS
jgi:hypothetical protein